MDQRLPWIIGLSIVVGVIAIWRSRKGRERRKRFERREELDLDTIYYWFFAHLGLPREMVLELWCEVAESLGLPASKLRPTDRFEVDLAFSSGFGFENETVGLALAEMRRFERYGDLNLHGLDEVQTLGDYIEFCCDLEMQSHRHNQERAEKIG